MISAFNPYITKNAKVFRGGSSAVYGNHVSGVIDMRSDQIFPQEFSGGLGSNLTHADIYLKSPVSKKIGLLVASRRSLTDLLNTFTFRELSKKVFQNTIMTRNNEMPSNLGQEKFNEFLYKDFNIKIFIDNNPKDNLAISYLHNINRLDYLLDIRAIDETSKYFLHIVNKGISGIWRRRWNENLRQKTKIYHSDYDLTYNFNRQNLGSSAQGSLDKTNRIKELSFQSMFNWKFKKRSSMNFGYEMTNSDVGFDFKDNFLSGQESNNFGERNKNNTHTLFGEYIFKNGDRTILRLGMRNNYFSLTEHFFLSPRFYAQVELFPQFWIKTSGEIKQQNIGQIVEFLTQDFGLENQIWVLTNSVDIPHLKSNQLSLGLIFERNGWSIDVDAYHKEIDGLSSLKRGLASLDNGNFSKGKSTSRGLDVFIKKKWKDYSSWVSYSLSNTSYKFETLNDGRPFAGNYDTRHQFLWANSLKSGNFNFSLGWNLRTGVPYTKAIGINTDNSSVIDYEAINAARLPLYHRLDFSTTYSFHINSSKGWKGKIGFSLLNVFNKKNILQRTYRPQFSSDGTSSLIKTDIFSLGVTPDIVLRIQF